MSAPLSRARAWLALFLMLFVLGSLAVAAPAQAHTDLVDADPANGATVDRLPARATLTFNSDVTEAEVTVSLGGVELPVSHAPSRPESVTADLRRVKRDAGPVALTWTLVSSHDGHETSGVIRFRIRGDDPAGSAPPPERGTDQASSGDSESAAEQAPRTIGALERSARAVGYLAMAVLVGGLLFVSFLWPAGADERRTRRVFAAAVVGGLAAAALGAVLLLRRIEGELTLDGVLTGALAEDYGRPYPALVLLWLLAAVVVAALAQGGESVVRRLPWRLGALVVAVGLLRTTGMNSHATETAEPVWGAIADFLHLTGVSAWVGGLTVLLVCLLPRRDLAELQQVIPRFSRVAFTSVLLIVASGLILVWQILGGVGELWSTEYGRVFAVKLAVFGLVLFTAMHSRRWVNKSLGRAAHRTGAVRVFALSVAAESALVITVLGAASVLTTSSPGV